MAFKGQIASFAAIAFVTLTISEGAGAQEAGQVFTARDQSLLQCARSLRAYPRLRGSAIPR